MVHGNSSLNSTADTIQNAMSSVKHQVSVITNMIVTAAAVFGMCYFVGTKVSQKKSVWLMFGLAGAMMILIVEMILYIIRACKQDDVHTKVIAADKAKNNSMNIVPE